MASARRPNRLVRWLFRIPLLLYHLGIPGYERIFGLHWILVTTKGRRTGKPRRVLLDIVGHDPTTDRYYVQPGWGRQSAWVRNIEAHPVVEAQVGRKCFRARVIDASGPEGAEWIFAFARKHRLQSLVVARLMPELAPPQAPEAQVKEWYARNLLVFALAPISGDQQASG